MFTPRLPAALLVVMLAQGAAGCADSETGPSPSPVGSTPVAMREQTAVGPCGTTETTFYGCAYTRRGVSLTGRVYESTQTGPVGISGVYVYCEACGLQTHTWAMTDSNGFYRFSGDLATGGGVWLAPGFLTAIGIEHAGYQDPPGLAPLHGPMFVIPSGPGWREVLIDSDTQFDIQLARR